LSCVRSLREDTRVLVLDDAVLLAAAKVIAAEVASRGSRGVADHLRTALGRGPTQLALKEALGETFEDFSRDRADAADAL
jgi:hypothetical protein